MKKSYLKTKLVYILILFFTVSIYAQNGKSIWTKTTFNKVASMNQLYERTQPTKVNYYQLDLDGLKDLIKDAQQRGNGNSISNTIISFPNADGDLESFRIQEASTMSPELQAQFPEIRSYSGVGIDNPSAMIRFSVSPEKGLSSMVLSDKKTVFIEPYSDDLTTYSVYIRSVEDVVDSNFICETDSIDQGKNDIDIDTEVANRNANDGQLRTFRLALACTIEYSAYHGNTVSSVLAAMNTTMTRVNGVFERDVSLTMQIVPNNANVVFIGTDNFTNNDGGAMLNENQTACDTNIGNANYDIGHVFSTGGGGIAQLYSPCNTGSKARGVTGSPAPIGDFFDIDYVAHEMGHQYGANHTQNNNCQRSSKSFEPGSASTIMGYAGICSPNVQNNSDDYFHGESIREMWANISTGASTCGAQSATGNGAPTANAGSNHTIPVSTPFVLRGNATDPNGGNSLTYCWEQMDATPATMPPVSTSTAGPAFRSIQPKTSPDRYMPALSTVLAGSTSTTWEVVPSVGRTMNFDLVVRDNVSGGASTDSDGMVVTTSASAGPFAVTSQTSNVTWEIGSTQTVTWDVANTNAAPVNTANVNILMSINGGATFPYTIASNVPNDGSHDITVPAGTATTQARIIVEGANNIFYNVNSSNFTVINADFVMNFASSEVTVCKPDNAVYNFTYNTFGGFSQTTVFSATNLPGSASASFSPSSASLNGTAVTMTISNTASVAIGSYNFNVVGTAPSATNSTQVSMNVSSYTVITPVLSAPANGSTDVASNVDFTWNTDLNSDNYFIEISTDNSFSNIVDSATVTAGNYSAALSTNTTYYWRVTPSNQCATGSASTTFSFTTANISCETYTATDTPIAISASGTPTVTSVITVDPDLPITDVNVTIDIIHTWVNDLDITLTSPNGTVVELTSDNGASGADNYTNTIFDQEASNPITGGTAPFTGTFIPEGDLTTIYGEMSGGDWTLTVFDDTSQDGGSVNEFTIELCVQGSLGVEESSFDEFAIYPNPNSGEFTIRFNSSSSRDVNVGVFDIRGRKVLDNFYNNSGGIFNENINLGNVASGMYLVMINDGVNTSTKRIIVE